MAEGESAPNVGQPEATGQQQGQPDWAAERADFERKLAEYEQRETRYRQQIDGNQRAFRTLSERGYKSWDEVMPHLDAIDKARKAGLDFDRFGKAFEPDEPAAPGFDMAKAAQQLAPVIKQQLAEETWREQVAEIGGSVGVTLKEALGNVSERELAIATGFVQNAFYNRLVDQSVRPATAMKEAIAEYRKFSKDAEVESQAQRAVEMADRAKAPARTPREQAGGMGRPTAETTDDKRSRRVAALEKKYQQIQQQAMSRSE